MKKGAATILMVFLVTLMGAFVFIGWQSRLLLLVHRNQSLSDILRATYDSESEIFDIVAKFLGNYPAAFNFPFSTSKTLADGTLLETTGTHVGNTQTIDVTGKRTFATNKMQISRVISETSEAAKSDIVLVLDCTGSMGEKACASCSTTRMEEQEKAVLGFLDDLEATPGNENIKLGISVFTLNADWLYTSYTGSGDPSGVAVKPDSGLSIAEMRQAVTSGFSYGGEQGSPACKHLLTYTSIGSGVSFAHDYLRTTASSGNKQIEVVISDGEPNQRIPVSSGCPLNIFCPGDGNYCCPSGSLCNKTKPLSADGNGWSCPAGSGTSRCEPYARDFLRCVMADSNTDWVPEKYTGPTPKGVRDPNVDVYAVTVLDNPPASVTQIFSTYATKYYNSADADDLSEILEDIFEEIITLSTITIKRVVPTPVR